MYFCHGMQTHGSQQICQSGIVERIDDEKVFVRIESQAACGNCRAKSYCGMVESTDKVVEVLSLQSHAYAPGQRVEVLLERALGYKALLMGYMFPFLLLLVGLFASYYITGDEAVSALVAVALVAPYYGLLYRFRASLRQTFRFSIRPM